MMHLWSPHSTGAAVQVIGYLLDPVVTQWHGPEPRLLQRAPAPELLHGDRDLVAALIDGLETRHRYACATLSYAPGEIDLVSWVRRDPALRRKVDAALALWMEVAFASVVPRCVWRDGGGGRLARSYNPNPPRGAARRLWAAYQDTVNGTFGWADPGDPRRAAPIAGPSWLLKRAVAAERRLLQVIADGAESAQVVLDALAEEPAQVQLMVAAREAPRLGLTDRPALLDSLAPTLHRLAWRVDHLRPMPSSSARNPRPEAGSSSCEAPCAMTLNARPALKASPCARPSSAAHRAVSGTNWPAARPRTERLSDPPSPWHGHRPTPSPC